ncbi:unnamed protein product, partial [Soboliphyme baturini]|uniref:Uncharacterized protein n=1 Tax=Soboliphyme baturini TaxID=241478 RepID=A0A183IZZ0_9BILA
MTTSTFVTFEDEMCASSTLIYTRWPRKRLLPLFS